MRGFQEPIASTGADSIPAARRRTFSANLTDNTGTLTMREIGMDENNNAKKLAKIECNQETISKGEILTNL